MARAWGSSNPCCEISYAAGPGPMLYYFQIKNAITCLLGGNRSPIDPNPGGLSVRDFASFDFFTACLYILFTYTQNKCQYTYFFYIVSSNRRRFNYVIAYPLESFCRCSKIALSDELFLKKYYAKYDYSHFGLNGIIISWCWRG